MSQAYRKSESIVLNRTSHKFVSATGSGTYGANETIVIDLASNRFLDMETLYFSYRIAVSGATTDVGFNRYTSASMFRELRIHAYKGAQLGQNVSNYNVLARKQAEMLTNSDNEAGYLDATEGSTGVTVASQGTSIAIREYTHRPVTHILAMKGYFPAKYLRGLTFELDLDTDLKVLPQTSGTSAATYTITNFRIYYDEVDLKPAVEQAMLADVNSPEGLVIDYITAHIQSDLVKTSTSNEYRFNAVSGRVKSLYGLQVPVKANQSIDELDTFNRNLVTSYRWKLANKYLTSSAIQVDTVSAAVHINEMWKAYKTFYEPQGLYGNSSLTRTVLVGDSAGGKFVMAQNVDREKSDDVLSSLRDQLNNEIILETNHSASATANKLYIITMLDKRMKIFPGNMVVDDDFRQISTLGFSS